MEAKLLIPEPKILSSESKLLILESKILIPEPKILSSKAKK